MTTSFRDPLIDAFTIRGPYYSFLNNLYETFIPDLLSVKDKDEFLSKKLVETLDQETALIYGDAYIYVRKIRNILTHSNKEITRRQIKDLNKALYILEELEDYDVDIAPLLIMKKKVQICLKDDSSSYNDILPPRDYVEN